MTPQWIAVAAVAIWFAFRLIRNLRDRPTLGDNQPVSDREVRRARQSAVPSD